MKNNDLSKMTPQELCELGEKYLEGKDVEQDYAKAFECFQIAANHGYAAARTV